MTRQVHENRRSWIRLNPPASATERTQARAVAEYMAERMMQRGATAVLLAGSWARGDAHRHSDIDLWSLRDRSGHATLWREPFIVNVYRTTERIELRHLQDPAHVTVVVPAWRQAIPLRDPEGIARRIQSKASRFRWSSLGSKCDRWVARNLTEWAEEALKLVRALAEGNLPSAAIQRNQLVDGLGLTMAVHRRALLDSEAEWWKRVGRLVGGSWGRLYREAIAVDPGAGLRSCRSALALYAETAQQVWPVFSREQGRLITHTCRIIGHPVAVSE